MKKNIKKGKEREKRNKRKERKNDIKKTKQKLRRKNKIEKKRNSITINIHEAKLENKNLHFIESRKCIRTYFKLQQACKSFVMKCSFQNTKTLKKKTSMNI